MNATRRNTLKKAIELLQNALDIVEAAQSEEQYCLDNIPENLQDSDRASAMEEAIDNLQSAMDCIEEAKENINDAMNWGAT